VTEPRTGRADGSIARVDAVLFDLDDTLFDHRNCARAALASIHNGYACFSGMAFDALERAHAELLEELHRDVMLGRVDIDTARAERFRRLFATAGVDASGELAHGAARTYREAYVAARRSIPGAVTLMARVRERARLVVVSNNILAEQQEKLRHCGLDGHVDALVVSEEVGVSKPDPAIFRAALARVSCAPEHAVMIGDSWTADIAGARAAGIRAIWFNPLGLPKPEPAPDVAEVRSLDPVEDLLDEIFTSRSHAHRH
jgi:HAD superfamily hydrolase (TIGR01549 family)